MDKPGFWDLQTFTFGPFPVVKAIDAGVEQEVALAIQNLAKRKLLLEEKKNA